MEGQLLRFRVTNHRSLRDEQELSFVASASGKDDPRLLRPEGLDEAVLPVCAMYGANASGKSNVIHALGFMQHAVVSSQRLWEPTEGVPIDPFALSDEPFETCTFIVDIMLGGVRYEYGFAVDAETVREEWLYAWPTARKQEWFSREKQRFSFNRTLRGENKAIEALTRPNSLFLSAAAQNNHEQLTPVFEWFSLYLRGSGNMRFRRTAPWWKQFATEAAGEEAERLRTQVRTLLRAADLGIVDFRVTEESAPSDDEEEDRPSNKMPRRQQLSFAHRAGERAAWLDLEEESTGTQALVGLLPTLLPLLDRGGMIAIDELNSLHPMLAMALLQIFQDPARNPKGAQLLFNTHDSSLLGTLLADPAPLRRDQIWFTEKDKDGATHLYPLTDYTPRAAENLERGYLQGRYGAVPFLGSFDWNGSSKAEE
jgi:uncharacterized protein